MCTRPSRALTRHVRAWGVAVTRRRHPPHVGAPSQQMLPGWTERRAPPNPYVETLIPTGWRAEVGLWEVLRVGQSHEGRAPRQDWRPQRVPRPATRGHAEEAAACSVDRAPAPSPQTASLRNGEREAEPAASVARGPGPGPAASREILGVRGGGGPGHEGEAHGTPQPPPRGGGCCPAHPQAEFLFNETSLWRHISEPSKSQPEPRQTSQRLLKIYRTSAKIK